MKVALDLDGVLADVIASWLVHNNKIRRSLSKKDLTSWDFWKKFQIDRFIFYEELSMCWKDWKSISCTEQDLSGVTKRLSDVAQVDIVTAREKSTDSHARDWLQFHGIVYDNYVPVTHGPKKAELDYDFFIDDSPINALNFLQNKKTVILYSQPWNQYLSHPAIHRISQLSDAIKILKS